LSSPGLQFDRDRFPAVPNQHVGHRGDLVGLAISIKGEPKPKAPPGWIIEQGHPVAIVGKKKCRIRQDGGQFIAEYEHGARWREVGAFATEGEAKATCAARFGSEAAR